MTWKTSSMDISDEEVAINFREFFRSHEKVIFCIQTDVSPFLSKLGFVKKIGKQIYPFSHAS